MPSLGSGYSVADFLRRLQGSPVSHMAGHYHENRLLFIHREDFFVKAIFSLPWEHGAALLRAAYHTQALSPTLYRAMLARMVLHNQFVSKDQREAVLFHVTASASASPSASTLRQRRASHTTRYVPWRAALEVYSEAMHTHGTQCPTQLARSTLRLLVPHHSWRAALSILQLEQANDRLTKAMLVDAARVCAAPEGAGWEMALAMLHHVHQQDEHYLSNAIIALRPPGTDALTLEQSKYSLLPDSSRGTGEGSISSPRHRHIIAVLADVTAAVPWETALSLPLCRSYWSHLVASTTLAEESKAFLIARALRQVPWFAAQQLLFADTVPSLSAAATLNPLASHSSDALLLTGTDQQDKDDSSEGQPGRSLSSSNKKRSTSQKRKGKRRICGRRRPSASPALLDSQNQTRAVNPLEPLQSAMDVASSQPSQTPEWERVTDKTKGGNHAPTGPMLPDALLMELRDAPATLSVLLASIVDKLPSAAMAFQFLQDVRRRGREAERGEAGVARRSSAVKEVGADSGLILTESSGNRIGYATQLPVVRSALLRQCAASPSGWRVALPMLLQETFLPTPPALLSALVRQLREAGEVQAVVRLLQGHVIPSNSQLEPWAMTMAMECILTFNAAHGLGNTSRTSKQQEKEKKEDEPMKEQGSAPQPQPPRWLDPMGAAASPSMETKHHSTSASKAAASSEKRATGSRCLPLPVEWQTALTLLLHRQVHASEERVTRTGTGKSAGAVAVRPTAEKEPAETPLTPAQLRLSVCICVNAGSCLGAIRVLGYARRVDRTSLPLSREITALLYCMHYNRPSEALAILAQVEKKHGVQKAKPLRHILSLYGPWKDRVNFRLPQRSPESHASFQGKQKPTQDREKEGEKF